MWAISDWESDGQYACKEGLNKDAQRNGKKHTSAETWASLVNVVLCLLGSQARGKLPGRDYKTIALDVKYNRGSQRLYF